MKKFKVQGSKFKVAALRLNFAADGWIASKTLNVEPGTLN
jgi:hypothetical protein